MIDTESRAVVSTLHVPGQANALACSRDGVTLYFGTESGGLQIANRKTGQSRFVRAGIEGTVHHLALSPGEE